MKKIISNALVYKYPETNRVAGLDIFRTAAIVFVVIAHYSHLIIHDAEIQNVVFNYCGYIGVELFFVLSGFLIGAILQKTFEQSADFSFTDIKQFWIRRWLRTLPLYYVFLLVNAFLYFGSYHKFIFSDSSYLLYFVFLQSFWKIHPGFFAEAWSLCIEEWFYLILPCIFLSLSFLKIPTKSKILFSIILFMLLILCLKTFFCVNENFSFEEARNLVPLRLDSLLFGVLAAFVYRHSTVWKKFIIPGLIVGGISCIVLSWLLISKIFYNQTNEVTFLKIYLPELFSFSFALLLPFFNSVKNISIKFLRTAFVFTSAVSYSMYLCHVPVLRVITFFRFPDTVTFILSWMVTLFLSMILFNLFEKPITNLRDKLSKRISL